MDKSLARKIAAFQKKAKESKLKAPQVKHEPSSLEKFIKTKEQADRFMKQLNAITRGKP